MKTVHNKSTVGLIGCAPTLWSDYLEQVCPVGITPSFVMDQTAREGP
ncbi:MAG TPA: hypothetical protein VN937_28680 [Blastocatellia bacterium]|nr:hypothetical protein [Blastocatellia bacterium]